MCVCACVPNGSLPGKKANVELVGCAPGLGAVTPELLWRLQAAPGEERNLTSLFTAGIVTEQFHAALQIPSGGMLVLLYTSENGASVKEVLTACTAVPGNLSIFFSFGIRMITFSLLEQFDKTKTSIM